mmetsp:Transcript_18506/g.16383  ORF Transcript_18506/g.16383 Transcript_18506/m.16383 type:complete len:157 (-) Transcript_18506:32-502(-)
MLINGNDTEEVYRVISEEIEGCGNEEVVKWYQEAKKDQCPKISKMMGWIKHAFVLSLRYLRLAKDEVLDGMYYEKCIKETLKGGGDTDTNACIVGGVIGAMIGFSKLPETPKEKVLGWPTSIKDGIKRDDFLKPSKHAEKLIKKLYDLAPEELHIK